MVEQAIPKFLNVPVGTKILVLALKRRGLILLQGGRKIVKRYPPLYCTAGINTIKESV